MGTVLDEVGRIRQSLDVLLRSLDSEESNTLQEIGINVDRITTSATSFLQVLDEEFGLEVQRPRQCRASGSKSLLAIPEQMDSLKRSLRHQKKEGWTQRQSYQQNEGSA